MFYKYIEAYCKAAELLCAVYAFIFIFGLFIGLKNKFMWTLICVRINPDDWCCAGYHYK